MGFLCLITAVSLSQVTAQTARTRLCLLRSLFLAPLADHDTALGGGRQ